MECGDKEVGHGLLGYPSAHEPFFQVVPNNSRSGSEASLAIAGFVHQYGEGEMILIDTLFVVIAFDTILESR